YRCTVQGATVKRSDLLLPAGRQSDRRCPAHDKACAMISYRLRFSLLLLLLVACGFCLMLAAAPGASAQSDAALSDGSVVAAAAGETHTCLLTSDGAVWCWGANSYGQLGDGTRTNRRVPVAVIGLTSGVQAIAVGG